MKRTQGLTRPSSMLVAATLGLGGLTTVVFGAGPSPAQGLVADPACGDTITVDTTLQADLIGCPSNGLVIGADDLTLDLNGHTIDGDAALQDPCPDDTSCDWGVDNGAGHSGLTVVNGTVTDFDFGVVVGGAEDIVLSRLTATDNISSGIVVFDSTQVRIRHSTVARNGLDTDFSGLGIFNTSDGVLSDTLVRHNGDIGLYAEGMDDQRIVGNTFSGNPEAGLLFDGSGNVLTRNFVSRNGDGIAFAGDANVVTDNRITRSLGCPDGCGNGISYEGGTGSVFAWNIVSRAQVGIRVDAYTGLANHTVVRRNIIRRSARDDIAINPEHVGRVRNTRVAGNIVTRAGDDGIDVDSASTTISGNLAVRNHDLGIEAVAGVTGGGNKVAANGDPRQCTHVACRDNGDGAANRATRGSPRNGQIVFRRYFDAEQSKGAVFMMNPDGSHARQLTHPPKGWKDNVPAWSSDGKWVTFERFRSNESTSRIMVVNADTGDARTVVPCTGERCVYAIDPYFSPDGDSIAYARTVAPRNVPHPPEWRLYSAIFVVGRDGSNPHQVSRTPRRHRGQLATETSDPTFSPNSKLLAFLRARHRPEENTAVFVQPIGSPGEARRITPWRLSCQDRPTFSPAGKRLLFRCQPHGEEGPSNLYWVRPDGTDLHQITHAPADKQYLGSGFSPTFRKGRGWITAGRTGGRGEEGNADVFRILIKDGKVVRKVNLTRSRLWDSSPGWGTHRPVG